MIAKGLVGFNKAGDKGLEHDGRPWGSQPAREVLVQEVDEEPVRDPVSVSDFPHRRASLW